MTNEEWNTKVYEKLFEEQEKYKGWLLTQSPEVILNHTYEYTIREDILLGMEYLDLSDEQAKALLSSPSPLSEIFHDFEKIEGDHMDIIRDCIENCADDLIKRQRENQRTDVGFPSIYPHSAAYAREHGELEQYRASMKANVECKTAVEDAIANHYADNRLDPAGASAVLAKFGAERTSLVLAATVQDKDWDGRISQQNKEWAKTISVPQDKTAWDSKSHRQYVVSRSHPGLIDLFVSQTRRELAQQEKEKKPSIMEKLAVKSEEKAKTGKEYDRSR